MGMKPRKRLWRWVTREGRGDATIWPGTAQPELEEATDSWGGRRKWDQAGGLPTFCCVEEFKAISGFIPKADSCQKVSFSIRKVN